jgi:hypothetical protein
MIDLRHHGDAELAPGLVDLAVNVRAGTPPRNCGPCCTRRWTTAPVVPTPADLPRTVVAEAIRPPVVWVVGDVVGLHPVDASGGAAR